MQNLPTELCRLIFNELSIVDLDNLRLVAVRFNNIIGNSARYWKLKYQAASAFSIRAMRRIPKIGDYINYSSQPCDLQFIIGYSRLSLLITDGYIGNRGIEYGPYDIICNFKEKIWQAIDNLGTEAKIRSDYGVNLVVVVDVSFIRIMVRNNHGENISEYNIPKTENSLNALIKFCQQDH